jgi:hypothetical protein
MKIDEYTEELFYNKFVLMILSCVFAQSNDETVNCTGSSALRIFSAVRSGGTLPFGSWCQADKAVYIERSERLDLVA